MVDDLRRVLDQGGEVEQAAAILALSRSPDRQAAELMRTRPALSSAAARGELSWQALAVGNPS
jgi:hypothetical protein